MSCYFNRIPVKCLPLIMKVTTNFLGTLRMWWCHVSIVFVLFISLFFFSHFGGVGVLFYWGFVYGCACMHEPTCVSGFKRWDAVMVKLFLFTLLVCALYGCNVTCCALFISWRRRVSHTQKQHVQPATSSTVNKTISFYLNVISSTSVG